MNERKEVVFSDIPSIVTGGFKPATGVAHGWVTVSYETADIKGTAVAAGFDSNSPELTLDLGLSGLYVLYFALGPQNTALRVWLDGDEGFREFFIHHNGDLSLLESRLAATDLTGRKLHIARKTSSDPQAAFLGYIRAEPVEAIRKGSGTLVVANDGWSWIGWDGLDSARDARKFFEPFRESDVGLMLWGTGGADLAACHQTRVGTTSVPNDDKVFIKWDQENVKNMRKLAEQNGDVLKETVAAARDVGIKIHFYIRPEAFIGPFPFDDWASNFLLENPQWRCRDEHGDEIMRMSYAFPQVQDHMLKYFAELLEYQPDGLCFAFTRSLPMMICEEPVLAEFEKMQGRRPKLPEEVDSPEMVAARTALMNNFLDRVHQLLAGQGKEMSAIVLPGEEEMRVAGLDLSGLVEKEFFDAILIHNGGMNVYGGEVKIKDSEFWKKLRDSAKTRVYPNGYAGVPWHVPVARYLKDEVFDPGFAGGFVWDAELISKDPLNWEGLRKGGTMEYLHSAVAGTEEYLQSRPRVVLLTQINGMKMGKYNPMRSY